MTSSRVSCLIAGVVSSPPSAPRLAFFVALMWGLQSLLRGFWEPDEARFVYVAGEMAADGRFFVPFRHGEFYAHKPPLMFWLMNLAALPFGGAINGFAARLPSMLGVFLSLRATAEIAAKLGGAAAAWRAVAVLSTAFLFWQTGTMGQMDALLTGLEMAAFAALWDSAARGAPASARRRFGAGFLLGLAFLLKGPVALAVPSLALAAVAIANGLRPRLTWLASAAPALAGAALPPLFWLGGVWLEGAPREYFREVVFGQTVERAAGAYGHLKSPFYFLFQFPLDFLPWTLALPFAWTELGKEPDGEPAGRAPRKTLAAWFAAVLLFFSLIASKRNLYILMAYPAAAILIALAWERLPRVFRRAAPALLAAFLLAGTAGYAALDKRKVPYEIKDAVAAYVEPGGRLALLGTNGEICALYAERKGLTFWSQGKRALENNDAETRAFAAYIAATDNGVAVVARRFWRKYGADIEAVLRGKGAAYETRELKFGKKRETLLLWRGGKKSEQTPPPAGDMTDGADEKTQAYKNARPAPAPPSARLATRLGGGA